VHQPAGCIINEHEQRALRTTILKPPVLAAVDLHQLANAVAPGAGLMDALSPLLAIHPQLGLDHPQPQCLATEPNPMNLLQLLRRQEPALAKAGVGPKSQYRSRISASAACRTASGLRRLLRRPRRFEITPVAPSARYAFNSRNTWRRSSPSSCAAASVVNRFRSRSRSTSSRDSSPSLISRTVTLDTPRKTPGECHL
jgi:hypothetical protein